MAFFRLRQDVYFQRGARRAALYDLGGKELLQLDEEGALAVACTEGNMASEQVERVAPGGARVLNDLVAAGAGRWYSTPVVAERYLRWRTVKATGIAEGNLALKAVFVQLTSACSCTCPDCGGGEVLAWQGCNGCERWPGVPAGATMSAEVRREVLDALADLRFRTVFVCGGSPTECRVLVGFLTELRTRCPHAQIVVTNNGVNVDRNLVGAWQRLAVAPNFTIFGCDPDTSGAVTGRPSQFAELLAAMELCREAGVSHTVTACDGTVGGLRTAATEAVADIHARFNVGTYRWERLRPGQSGHRQKLSAWGVDRSSAPVAPGAVEFFERQERHPCVAGMLAITAMGDIRVCPMVASTTIGDVRSNGLRACLRERRPDSVWQITKASAVGCHHCEYKYACVDCLVVEAAKRADAGNRTLVCDYDPCGDAPLQGVRVV